LHYKVIKRKPGFGVYESPASFYLSIEIYKSPKKFLYIKKIYIIVLGHERSEFS